jgi:hypothetical protein
MNVTKIIDLDTNYELEMYENDSQKMYLELKIDGEYPNFITLDKEDCISIVRTLNEFING